MPRPASTWIAYWTFVLAVLLGGGLGISQAFGWDKRVILLGACLIGVPAFLYFVWALRKERLPPPIPAPPTRRVEQTVCEHCHKPVPTWFTDSVDHGDSETTACLACLDARPRARSYETVERYTARLARKGARRNAAK